MPDPGLQPDPPAAARLEDGVASIFREVLARDQVGHGDSFFDLGGDSLEGSRVISRINEQLGVELTVPDLFEHPSIESLAREVAVSRRAVARTALAAPRPGAAPDDAIPLTPAQESLWFIDQLLGPNGLYNMPCAARLRGALDVAALEHALQALLRRHDGLRTGFAQRSAIGAPVRQVVAPETLADGLRIEISSDAPASVDGLAPLLAQWLGQRAAMPFDLSAAPLLRAHLLRLSHDEHVLLIVVHHIVSDGWSQGVMLKELGLLYHPPPGGEALAALPIQCADHARWLHERLQGDSATRALAYWRERLQDMSAAELPTDRPRPAAASYRGALQRFDIDSALVAPLTALAQRQGATLFMLLLAAFKVLLMRHTRQHDIVVGVPTAARNRIEFEGLIGYFVNSLVLRTDLSGDPGFVELLERVRDNALGAYAHQELPFDRLVAELRPQRDLSRNPLYQVSFQLDVEPAAPLQLAGLVVERVDVPHSTSKFDLAVTVTTVEGRLHGAIEYATDLFDAGTVARLVAQYGVLLQGIADDPTQPLSHLPLLDDDERQRLWALGRGAAVAQPDGPCLRALVEAQVRRTPQATALLGGTEVLSYRDLNTRANRLAHHLHALGVGPGDFVAVCLQRSVASPVAALAVLKAGAVYVPMDAHDPVERRAGMLRDCAAKVLITQPGLDDGLGDADQHPIRLETGDPRTAEQAGDDPAAPSRPGDVACLIYTSGSSGAPKGVLVSQRGLASHAHWIIGALGLAPGDRVLHKTSAGFDASLVELLEPLAAGATIVIAAQDSERDTQALLNDVRAHAVTVLQMVPSALRLMLLEPTLAGCTSLRRLVCGGEALDRALAREVRRLLPQVALGNFYGPTEATIDAAWQEVLTVEPGAGSVPIGHPVPHARCHVLDALLQPVPPGIVGELFIGGAGLALGYLHQPELTAERFVADPQAPGERLYRSGDLARLRTDGALEFIGRADGQVKLRGVRIEIGEIEAALASCTGVRECAVALCETRPGLQQLVAYVCGDLEAVRSQLLRRLPAPMIPARFVLLDALPLLPSGKLDRAALPAPRGDGRDSTAVAARTPIEQTLVDIWRDVLGAQTLGVHDNFFALGGHSLMATQVASRARATFQIELELSSLFEAPTVAELAEEIERRLVPGQAELQRVRHAITRCDRAQPLHASFSQRRMWLLQQLEPEGVAYNLVLALRLRGMLDSAALQTAFDRVVRRHEAFRTTFRMLGNEPEILLGEPGNASIERIDLRELPPMRREMVARALMRERICVPFDLAAGPLHRIVLLRIDDHVHALLLLMHHSVCDDWSFGVLMRELCDAYAAARHGGDAEPAPAALEFADFAAWQRQSFDSAALQRQWQFWQEQLAGLQPLALRPDHGSVGQRSSRGASVERPLPAATLDALRQFSAEHGATPFMALLAVFQLLLARYTGQDDIAVGTPIANRTTIEAEPLVGTLVNTLVMRTQLGGDPSFVGLLERVRATSLAAYAHQDLPYDQLIEGLRRSPAGAPAELQVLFNVLNTPWDTLRFDGLDCAEMTLDTVAAQFDLALHVDLDMRPQVQLAYATDLYDSGSAERLLANYLLLLDQALAEPTLPLSELHIGTDAEMKRIERWNATDAPWDRTATVHGLVQAQAARHADDAALSIGTARLSHGELDTATNRLARALRSRGIGRGALVGLCVERGLDLVVAQLGILKSGAAYVPLDPDYPAERLATMAHDAGLALLVTQAPLAGRIAWPAEQGLLLDRDAAELAAQAGEPLAADAERDARPADPAYVIYTSGSTGKPKGVVVPHGAVVNFLGSMAHEPGLGADDRLLAVTTLSFDIAVLELLLPLTVGAQVVLVPRDQTLDGNALCALLLDSGATVMQATPSTWRLLIDAGWRGAPGFKALVGGESLPSDLARQLLERCGELWNMYGPTETTVWSTCWKVESPDAGIRIGRPIANTQVHVLDARQRPCPIGVAGEIFIGGDGVALGYLNRATLTAERFIADPGRPGARLYRTGDQGRWCHDGQLEHLGRLDFQVKVRGHRIELGEIEACLASHPAVSRCVVIVREDRPGDVRLVAYLVARDAVPANAALREHLRISLPDYMLPQHLVPLDTIPLLPNGKIDRRQLPLPADENALGGVGFTAPRNEREAAVADVWQRLLGIEQVSIGDNFFDLGGHSLLAARACMEIERSVGLRVAVRRLIFESLAQIAATPPQDPAAPPAVQPAMKPATPGWLGRLFGKGKP